MKCKDRHSPKSHIQNRLCQEVICPLFLPESPNQIVPLHPIPPETVEREMRGKFDKNSGTIQKSSLPNEKLQISEAFNFGVRLIPPFTDRLMRILRGIDLRKVSLPVKLPTLKSICQLVGREETLRFSARNKKYCIFRSALVALTF